MSVYDSLFNLGARGPGLPLAGMLRTQPAPNARFGSPRASGYVRNPTIGTKPDGKQSAGWRKV